MLKCQWVVIAPKAQFVDACVTVNAGWVSFAVHLIIAVDGGVIASRPCSTGTGVIVCGRRVPVELSNGRGVCAGPNVWDRRLVVMK